MGDENAQPGEQLEDDGLWPQHQKTRSYRQHLVQRLFIGICIDPAYGVEHQRPAEFPGKIIIYDGKTAITEAKKDLSTWALRTDGSS